MPRSTPQVTVKIDGSTQIATDKGQQLETRGGPGIVSVQVDLRLDNPDLFAVEFDMMALENLNLLDTFKPGSEVEITMGLVESGVLCTGEITYIEPSFDVETGYRTTISGYHKLHRLTRGHRSLTWGDGIQADQAPTTAVSQIINNSKAHEGSKKSDKMNVGQLTSTDLKLKYIPQLNVSDFEFLRAIGATLEYKAERDGSAKVKFTKPDPSKPPVLKLTRERGEQASGTAFIHAANFRLSTVQQYAAVEVRGWDPDKKKNIVAKVTSSSYTFDAAVKGAADTGKGLYGSASDGRKYVVVDQPVGSQDEAKALAQSLFDQFSMDFLTGDATIEGDPRVVPGCTVEFVGFGKAFSGVYLVTSATHSYRPEEGYRTIIAVARNAKGA